VYDPRDQVFRFHEGPVFTHILLADEINRASPRTQSALLEAMGEAQVSVDGIQRTLADVFFVIATQNPIEFRGTYPLPEAQMDRFALQFSLGYVSAEQEAAILTDQETRHPLESIGACASLADLLVLKEAVKTIRLSDELKAYIVRLIRATRGYAGVQLGASPRASLALARIAQALALFDGLDFVSPDQIQEAAVAAVAHRLVMDSQARFSGLTAQSVVEDILKKTPAPA
jgi:MoxR-like ATPase